MRLRYVILDSKPVCHVCKAVMSKGPEYWGQGSQKNPSTRFHVHVTHVAGKDVKQTQRDLPTNKFERESQKGIYSKVT